MKSRFSRKCVPALLLVSTALKNGDEELMHGLRKNCNWFTP